MHDKSKKKLKMNFSLKATIGVNDYERHIKQKLVVTCQLFGNIKKPVKKLVKFYIKNYFKNNRPKLIEKALYSITQNIINNNQIENLELMIVKPNAIKNAKYVGVSLSYER